jgi:hypothetical protein
MTSYPASLIASFCAQWAPSLQVALPSWIDAGRLLWAFTGNESSFGQDCNPRYDARYDTGGILARSLVQAALLQKFGSDAARSYGPLQIMLCNCPKDTTPEEISQLDIAFMCSVSFMKKQMQRFTPTEIYGCAVIWNVGYLREGQLPTQVMRYVNDLITNYQNPKVPYLPS